MTAVDRPDNGQDEGQVHELKTWPTPFASVLDGSKPYEIRRDDRGFAVGDVLQLREWDPLMRTQFGRGGYTGRSTSRIVTHVLDAGTFGLRDGYVALGVASGRAGAGEQQREHLVSLDDLRLSPRESLQMKLATVLTGHQPVHNPPRRGDCGPTVACTCGFDRLGEWFSWHVADELLAVLGGGQDDEGCTCHLRVEIAGHCPTHEPAPCPSTSHGDDGGFHCAVTGPHNEHRNAAGDVTWGGERNG